MGFETTETLRRLSLGFGIFITSHLFDFDNDEGEHIKYCTCVIYS
jgi:hypothetical protein